MAVAANRSTHVVIGRVRLSLSGALSRLYTRRRSALIAVIAMAAAGSGFLLGGRFSRVPAESAVPRMPDGHPDLSGIWQAVGAAYWDLEGHAARGGPLAALGAAGAIPASLGVVEGGTIPYQPWAAARKAENQAHWLSADPEVKCYMPGVPRATYMPFPFQIVQDTEDVLIAYEFASASRSIRLGKIEALPLETWMGQSSGSWDGDTLVVDVTGFTADTWFDRAGNFHSNALHVVERYTPIGRDRLRYDVTVEDPGVFTRPWRMSMPLYRRAEPNMQLLEFKCVEFAEELLYGHLYKDAR